MQTDFPKHIFFRIFLCYFRVEFSYSLLLLMKLFVLDFFPCTNKPSVAPYFLHICDQCTSIAKSKSGERYPNKVVRLGSIELI